MKGGYFFFQGKNPFDVGNALFKTCRSCQCENVFVKTNGLMKGKKRGTLSHEKDGAAVSICGSGCGGGGEIGADVCGFGLLFFQIQFYFCFVVDEQLILSICWAIELPSFS